MTIKSLKDIARTLQEGDELEFHFEDEIIKGAVTSPYVNSPSGINKRIFEKLGLDKVEFCKKAYGYDPLGGGWPEYRNNDYEALTRCVKALYKEMGHKSLTPTYMATLKDRFLTIFSKEPQKSFRKAGIVDGDNLLTDEGRDVFLSWLLNTKFGEEFKTDVVDELIKEQKLEWLVTDKGF